MKRSRKLGLQFLALICSLVALATSALSLMQDNSSAEVISLLAGSFAAGAILTSLVRQARQRRGPA
jgi:hypothetical protein